jgi:D-aminopeptidase
LKAFISVDLEGMPYIVTPSHLNLKGALYEEARKIATKITFFAADELHKNGFEEVIVADSHGRMVNIQVEELPEYVEIVRGFPRPLSMVAGVEGCSAAVFLGYHAKFGTAKSSFDHTYSGGSIRKVEVKVLVAKKPVNMRVTFLVSHFADVAALLPQAKRVDGLTIEYTAQSMTEAYKTFELLVLAASGISALLTQQT